MTLTQLKRLHALNKEIEYEKSRLQSIRSKSDHIGIAGIGSFKKSAFPVEIKALEAQIRGHLKECISLYREILEFVNSIPDSLVRLAISLRFINGLEWEQIALHIGGGNTADSIRKLCQRFLKERLSKC